jgi:hypothetical protein
VFDRYALAGSADPLTAEGAPAGAQGAASSAPTPALTNAANS